jgi:hypothetical protein
MRTITAVILAIGALTPWNRTAGQSLDTRFGPLVPITINASLGRGYNSVIGKVLTQCVHGPVAGDSTQIDEVEAKLLIAKTRSELEQDFNLAVGTRFGMGLFGGSAAVKRRLNSMDERATFAITGYAAAQSIVRYDPAQVALTGAGSNAAQSATFTETCGDSYIAGLVYGVELHASAKLTTSYSEWESTNEVALSARLGGFRGFLSYADHVLQTEETALSSLEVKLFGGPSDDVLPFDSAAIVAAVAGITQNYQSRKRPTGIILGSYDGFPTPTGPGTIELRRRAREFAALGALWDTLQSRRNDLEIIDRNADFFEEGSSAVRARTAQLRSVLTQIEQAGAACFDRPLTQECPGFADRAREMITALGGVDWRPAPLVRRRAEFQNAGAQGGQATLQQCARRTLNSTDPSRLWQPAENSGKARASLPLEFTGDLILICSIQLGTATGRVSLIADASVVEVEPRAPDDGREISFNTMVSARPPSTNRIFEFLQQGSALGVTGLDRSSLTRDQEDPASWIGIPGRCIDLDEVVDRIYTVRVLRKHTSTRSVTLAAEPLLITTVCN